ncbi:MAG TPA: alpha/beta hydrolase [Caulobacteraceae bacterium]|jgi:pimeloyl-ACP methyl ester carboxylesterase
MTEPTREAWRWPAIVIGITALVAGAAVAGPYDAYDRPGQLVPVEGQRRLNLVCMGSGSPTVMLEAGAGDETAVWRKVQPEVAKFTRVCAYDRAGYGYSDPRTHPADATHAAEDLHRLIKAAGLGPSVVVVGHSVGGLYAELFAALYPRETAGLVLVDPTGLDDFRFAIRVTTPEEKAQQRQNYLKSMAFNARCLDLARSRPLNRSDDCINLNSTGDAELDQALVAQWGQAKYWDAYQSEIENFWPRNHPMGIDGMTTLEVRRHPMALGSKPLILLKTPGRVPPGERGERLSAWSYEAAQKIAAASTIGRVVKVNSGHYVHDEHPDIVVDAVRSAVEEVRDAGPPTKREVQDR